MALLHPDVVRAMEARMRRAAGTFAALRTDAANPLERQRRVATPRHVPEIRRD